MSKRILITGATGFVGSHILESLMHVDSYIPIAACRNKSALIADFQGEVRTRDLRDPDYGDKVVEGVDVICHAAAWTSLWNHKQQSHHNFLKPSTSVWVGFSNQ